MPQSMHTKIETRPVHVIVTTDDYEIDGYMHVKPGGYQSRISDLLNMREIHYIPITDASFRNVRFPEQPVRQAGTVIVRLDTIKMVVPIGSEQVGVGTVPAEASAQSWGNRPLTEGGSALGGVDRGPIPASPVRPT